MEYYLQEVVSERSEVMPTLVITQQNRDALNMIYRHLLNRTKMKGIILWGDVGNGKTVLMEMFRRCMMHIYKVGIVEFNSKYIRNNYYQNQGADAVTLAYKLHYHHQVLINDFGFEKPYSTGEDILQTVIFDRFESGKITHGTTNLTPSEFIQRYNDDKGRIADRLPLMFDFVEVQGKSLRK